jgi:hypothetical protein
MLLIVVKDMFQNRGLAFGHLAALQLLPGPDILKGFIELVPLNAFTSPTEARYKLRT